MATAEKNYLVSSLGDVLALGRTTLNEQLKLTGSEISINELPAGVSVPFVHAHKRNEEVYIILNGKGRLYIDGDEFEVGAGDVLRIDPAGERCITADEHSSIKFICIQTEANSLVQFTQNDGIPSNAKPSWPSPAAPLLPGPTSGATQWNCTLDAASGNHLDLSTGLEV